eukprot:Opistho-2@31421
MSNHPILGAIALGYAPLIDPQRVVTATRLTVVALRPDAKLEAAELLAAVAEVWPAGASTVVLNVQNEGLLESLLRSEPSPNLLIELPAFMATDGVHAEALLALKKHGNGLLLKGRPVATLPAELLPCFKYAVLDLDDESRGGADLPPMYSALI